MDNYSLDKLEERINYTFKDKKLIRQAMTHSSFTNEQKINHYEHYERVEFLGDAILEFVSSEFLYFENPKMSEGNLTKTRASAVCEQALAITARELELGRFMLFGKGEEATGGRERDSIIADAVEAVIGAIYLDGGMEEAKKFIYTFVLNDLEHKKLFYDAKSILMETVQKMKAGELSYVLLKEEGPEHNKQFFVAAMLQDKQIGTGVGRTKKAAEQQAAYEALMKMKK